MSGITESFKILTLCDFAASGVIGNGLTMDERVNQFLMARWDALKCDPKMPKEIAIMMQRIEGRVENTACLLFRKLAQKCEVSSCFGSVIPVSVEAYAYLYQTWEDAALFALRDAVCAQLGAAAPVLLSTKEVKDWFAAHVNAPELLGIEILHLADKKLRVLPSEIGCCSRLRQLNLINNRISFIPREMGSCTQLQCLDLGNNKISVLPSEIGSCTLLQWLNLSDNWIRSIPREIGSCNQLVWLDAGNNELSTLPAEIGSCALLEQLYLYGNEIVTLPAEISSCTELQLLVLSNSQNILSLSAEILAYIGPKKLLTGRTWVSLIETDQNHLNDVKYITKTCNIF
jgi:Leucine-rich repeat (LRR) protein